MLIYVKLKCRFVVAGSNHVGVFVGVVVGRSNHFVYCSVVPDSGKLYSYQSVVSQKRVTRCARQLFIRCFITALDTAILYTMTTHTYVGNPDEGEGSLVTLNTRLTRVVFQDVAAIRALVEGKSTCLPASAAVMAGVDFTL